MGQRNEQYEGIIVFTVNVRFGAPNAEEARHRLADVRDVMLMSRLPLGKIYRPYAPANMAGTPTIVSRDAEFDGLELCDES